MFQSAPPAREATRAGRAVSGVGSVSIRASRAGGDRISLADLVIKPKFQSAPPAREATYARHSIPKAHGGFNPRLPRGRRPALLGKGVLTNPVSIRASRAGGDHHALKAVAQKRGFNPRLPRGRRRLSLEELRIAFEFQSAPPAREATGMMVSWARRFAVSIRASRAGGDSSSRRTPGPAPCFNPRLPRGRRQPVRWEPIPGVPFQSAPPAREATICRQGGASHRWFQSAPPAREATPLGLSGDGEEEVSIRASRAGGDAAEHRQRHRATVSIRASRAGGDVILDADATARTMFQSAPPAREATPPGFACLSGHARFNPRLPRGRRLLPLLVPPLRLRVSIRASRAGGDANPRRSSPRRCPFQSAPPAREATSLMQPTAKALAVSIRASRAGGDES